MNGSGGTSDLLGLSSSPTEQGTNPPGGSASFSGILIDVLGDIGGDRAKESSSLAPSDGGIDLFTGSLSPEDTFHKCVEIMNKLKVIKCKHVQA